MTTAFVVDDIEYVHPYHTASVYVRFMVQIYDGDQRLCPMVVMNNRPKKGLMDSDIDEDYVAGYWSRSDE